MRRGWWNTGIPGALALTLGAGLVACGGGESPPPNTGPSATITFPPAGVLTDDEEIVVRGTATDENGVSGVQVDGVEATTTDGFATWIATVPIAKGTRTLTVSTQDPVGGSSPSAATVSVTRADVLLAEPLGVVLDAVNQEALVTDAALRAVIGIDFESGERRVVSGPGVGSGPDFTAPRGVALTITNDGLYVADPDASTLFQVSLFNGQRQSLSSTPPEPFVPADVALGPTIAEVPVTDPNEALLYTVIITDGARLVLSGGSAGSGPAFEIPFGVAADTFTFQYLVTDLGALALYGVGFSTGFRQVISAQGTGTGPVFQVPTDVAFDSFTNRALVTDAGSGRREVTEVNLFGGARTTLSGPSRGTGTAFVRPYDLSYAGGTNQLAVIDAGLDALFRVNPQSGNREVVSSGFTGSGLHMDVARGMALEGDTGNVLVTALGRQALWSIALSSGDRTILSSASTGNGVAFQLPVDVAWQDANTALVVDVTAAALIAVNLSNGNRTLFSGDGTGSGPDFSTPVAIDLPDGADEAVVVDSPTNGDLPAIFGVTVADGTRRVISGQGTGSGPALVQPLAAAVESGGATALVVDGGTDELLRVDLTTGARTTVSAAGMEPSFADAAFADVVCDEANERALVADPVTETVIAVSLTDGTRTTFSGGDEGVGPILVSPASLVLGPEDNPLLIDTERGSLFVLDAVSGARVIRSK